MVADNRSAAGKVLGLADWSIVALWLLVALATIAVALVISYTGSVPAPVRDEWLYTNPDDYLQHLFDRHHGHPFAVGRIAMALDYWFFDATGEALRNAQLGLRVAQVAAFVALGRFAGLTSRSAALLLTAFTAIAVFSPAVHSNLAGGFQFTFVLAFVAPIVAIVSLIAYARKPRWWRLALAFVMAALPTQALFNGVLAPALLLGLAWRLGLSRGILLAFAALFVAAILSILLSAGGPLEPQPLSVWVIGYTLTIIGAAPASMLAFAQETLSLSPTPPATTGWIFGALMLTAAAILCRPGLRWRNPNPIYAGLLAIFLYAAGSASLIALARYRGDGEFTLISRYAEVSSLFLAALGVPAALVLSRASPTVRRACLLAGVLAAAAFPLGGLEVVKNTSGVQRARLMAQTAQVNAIPNPGATSALAGPFLARRFREAVDLQTHHKRHFADRWARAVGAHEPSAQALQRVCQGAFWLRASRFSGYARFYGNVDDRDARLGRSIIVVDAAQTIVGYGLVRAMPTDFIAGLIKRDPSEVLGYAHIEPDDAVYTAYLANQDGLVCRFPRQANRRRPRAT